MADQADAELKEYLRQAKCRRTSVTPEESVPVPVPGTYTCTHTKKNIFRYIDVLLMHSFVFETSTFHFAEVLQIVRNAEL